MSQVFRHAARRLRRARVFTTTAVITLALGIGGASAVFTVVNGVLLQPLPYGHPEQLVDLSHSIVLSGPIGIDQSDATYLTYRAENRTFSDVGIYRATAVNMGGLSRSSGAAATPPVRAPAAIATAGVFGILGVEPERGRWLTDDDGRPGAAKTVVIGRALWTDAFGGDPAIVGARITIDGVERTIVGVAPAAFHFPAAETSVWLPLEIDPARTKSAAFDFRGLGRLRSGTTPVTAAADLARLLPRVPDRYPGRLTLAGVQQTHMRPIVRPLRDVIVGDVSRVLWIVLGAVGALFLIACANVANLFLARAEGRQRDLAVRRALGAARASLLADSLAEGIMVAGAGGALGLICAVTGVRVLQSFAPASSIPRLGEVRGDGAVLGVALGTAALAALLVSLIPVARSGSGSLSTLLMASGGGAAGRARHRARRALVAAQVALALVLLAAAGLLARSFAKLRAVDPGFDPGHAVAVRMTLPTAAYPTSDAAARAMLRAIGAVGAIGGVQAAGVTTKLPLDAEARQDSAVFIEDRPVAPNTIPPIHQIVFATPGYFRAMGIPLTAGRLFENPDPGGAPSAGPPEVIVSDAFARRYWSGASAIGKRVRMNPFDPWHVIVGVVGSVRDTGLEQAPAEVVYCPLVTLSAAGTPWTPRDVALVVRTNGDPTAVIAPIRRVIQSIDSSLPLYRVVVTSDLLREASARTTFTLLMLGVAAVVALVIGAVGIYGVVSYLVTLRTREIGIRLALGATPGDMRALVAKQALADAGLGVAIGVAAAVAATRVLAAILFDVSPGDPATLAGASALLLATALAASWLPARRAAALDPARTLRTE